MTETLRCYHCNEPLPTQGLWSARVLGEERPMCCAGCQAVAQAIVASGGENYYVQRTSTALDPKQLERLSAWADLLEDPAWTGRHIQSIPCSLQDPQSTGQSDLAFNETTLAIEGLRCGACAWLIERVLVQTPGVIHVRANASTARLKLRWNPRLTGLASLSQSLLKLGYAAVPLGASQLEEQRKRQEKLENRRLFIAGLGWAQVMMLALPEYLHGNQIESDAQLTLRLASLALCLPVLLYSGSGFFASAYTALRQGRLNMDVPISLGLLLAFFGSLYGLWTEASAVYFESVTMFLFLVLGARRIESIIRRRTMRRREELSLEPPVLAHRLSPEPGDCPPWKLKHGDVIRVPSGTRLPADTELVQTATELDLSSLTGEPHPVRKQAGDFCPEGSINLGPEIQARVTGSGAQGSLARLSQLAESAAAERPQWSYWADRIATKFTLGILSIAAASIVWAVAFQEPLDQWLPRLIAILVVSCPCALSVAGPAAYAASLAKLLENGVAVSSPDSLAKGWAVQQIAFDKTGTLTEPESSSVVIRTLGDSKCTTPEIWTLVSQLAADSHHPLAIAVFRASGAQNRGQPPQKNQQIEQDLKIEKCLPLQDPLLLLSDIEQRPGLGMQGRTRDGRCVRLGSKSFVQHLSPSAPTDDPEKSSELYDHSLTNLGATSHEDDRSEKESMEEADASLYLGIDGKVLAGFWLNDQPRPDAQSTINALQSFGLVIWVLSGDQFGRVTALAQKLGLPLGHAIGALRPEDKRMQLRMLQGNRSTVGMVGDGINDAPVLAQADLSIAVSSSAPLAKQRADVYLLREGLAGVADFIMTAQRTRIILNQNIAWAIGYNLTAIPLAAMGVIGPALAAVGMAGSSLVVMANAARLLR
jgi:Cu2+-exporting ATPase